MLTPEIIAKMQQLKNVLEANPEFLQTLKNTANEPGEHPLLEFAQQQGIDLTADEIQAFLVAIQSENHELDDALLELVAGGEDVQWYEFWKAEWWTKTIKANFIPT